MPQAWPHPPQLLLSVIGSLHVPPQLLEPVAQHFGSVLSERVVHVCNAPSPAATSSLSIGETVVDAVQECAP